MITPRQAFLTLEYDGKDISSDIRKDVENFTYTDHPKDKKVRTEGTSAGSKL